MKIHYDPSADALYITLKPARVSDTLEGGSGINIDVDAKGNPIGIEILYAVRRLGRQALTTLGIDLSGLEWFSREDRLMSTQEAAKTLGVSRQYVTKLVREGKVKASRAGRDWLVLRSSLEKLKGKDRSRKRRQEFAAVR